MSTNSQDSPVPEKKSANVPPPPSRQTRGLHVAVPQPDTVPDNMSKPNSGFQDLNFKVTPELHKAFKTIAAEHGIAMKDLLLAAIRCWAEQYGTDADKARLPKE